METTHRPSRGVIALVVGLALAVAWGSWPWLSAIIP